MNDITKRMLLFLVGCMGSRTMLVVISKYIPLSLLPVAGYIALIPAIGFMFFYLTGIRKTGPEVFGEKIWWNDLRPIHAILYTTFAYFAINKNRGSWKILLADLILGLFSFLVHHRKHIITKTRK